MRVCGNAQTPVLQGIRGVCPRDPCSRDPSKIAALSDNGRGADALVDAAGWRAASRAAALKRLGKADRDFVLAVFRGATWRELGTTRQGFNKRIRKISENFGFHPPPEKPSLKT